MAKVMTFFPRPPGIGGEENTQEQQHVFFNILPPQIIVKVVRWGFKQRDFSIPLSGIGNVQSGLT